MSNLEITLRILLAYFVVLILPILLILAGIFLVIRARKAVHGSSIRRYLGISLISLPLGVLAYFIAGIAAARIRGDAHFYGVPFAGHGVSNSFSDFTNILIWVALVFVVLAAILRSH